ncbi:MAG TPA: PIN domain-containing protein [Natrialbaceae archaeon]|nr:PIN domain-containing protein [Natrialbaceae archaeon]
MILDTSFLIDLFDGQQDAFEKGLELSEAQTVQRVPAPVVVELSYGAEFGGDEERRNVRNALRMYPIVEQDEAMAHRAGQLLARADQQADGESGIDKVDPMVAAVADLYDEPVLTANVDHFRMLGADVEAYRDGDRS